MKRFVFIPSWLGLIVGLLLSGPLRGSAPAEGVPPTDRSDAHYQKGNALERKGDYAGALAQYEAGRKAAEARGDHKARAKNELGIGYIKMVQGDYRDARERFQTARRIAAEQKDKQMLAEALVRLGDIHERVGQYREALQSYERAFAIARAGKHKKEMSGALNGIGTVYYDQRHYPQALAYFQRARKLAEELDDKKETATALTNIGYTKGNQGLYGEALEYLQSALKMNEELGAKRGMTWTLTGIGFVHRDQGSYGEAAQYLQSAGKMAEEMGDKRGMVLVLWGQGVMSDQQASYDQALAYYQRARKISAELGDKKWTGFALIGMGNVYISQGLYDPAIECLQSAQEMAEDLGEKRVMSLALAHMGLAYAGKKSYDQALAYYQRALQRMEEVEDQWGATDVLNSMGELYVQQGAYREAIACAQKARKISEGLQAKRLIGTALTTLGHSYIRQQKYPQATEILQQALTLGEEIKAPDIMGDARYSLANLYEKLGQATPALQYYQSAIAEVERVRARGGSEEGKAGFFAKNIDMYENLIRFLYEREVESPGAGYARQAFAYAERAKARAFLDRLAEARRTVEADVDRRLLQRRQDILQNISQIQTQLVRAGAESQRRDLHKKLEAEEAQFEELKMEIRRSHPHYAEFHYPEICTGDQAQKEILKEDGLLLEYLLGEDHSYLWAVSRGAFQMYPLPKRAEIERPVKAYLEQINQAACGAYPPSDGLSAALYDLLVQPAEALLAGKRQVLIVPDGILYYLPFEALRKGAGGAARTRPAGRPAEAEYLIEGHELSYAPSLTIFRLIAKEKGSKNHAQTLLAFGDPVYLGDGSGPAPAESTRGLYAATGFQFLRLPFSGEEVTRIGELFPAGRRRVFTREEAQEAKVKWAETKDYQILHFATHAVYDEDRPMRSAIVLSLVGNDKEDGFLQMREILGLKLNCELVVLSACQTGWGQMIRGEGLIGLTRAFLYAGSSSVVASLWNVNDRSTADFMARFYYYLQARGQTKAAALRQTKLDMLKEARYQHPYYWAPFLLMGEAEGRIVPSGLWGGPIYIYGLILLAAAVLIEMVLRRKRSAL